MSNEGFTLQVRYLPLKASVLSSSIHSIHPVFFSKFSFQLSFSPSE